MPGARRLPAVSSVPIPAASPRLFAGSPGLPGCPGWLRKRMAAVAWSAGERYFRAVLRGFRVGRKLTVEITPEPEVQGIITTD